jgi:hypothetical protein
LVIPQVMNHTTEPQNLNEYSAHVPNENNTENNAATIIPLDGSKEAETFKPIQKILDESL